MVTQSDNNVSDNFKRGNPSSDPSDSGTNASTSRRGINTNTAQEALDNLDSYLSRMSALAEQGNASDASNNDSKEDIKAEIERLTEQLAEQGAASNASNNDSTTFNFNIGSLNTGSFIGIKTDKQFSDLPTTRLLTDFNKMDSRLSNLPSSTGLLDDTATVDDILTEAPTSNTSVATYGMEEWRKTAMEAIKTNAADAVITSGENQSSQGILNLA